MKNFKSKTIIAYVFSLLAIGCGTAPPPNPFAKKGLVCATDGFCVATDNGDYFYGAFRLGDKELQFKTENLGWTFVGAIKGAVGGRSSCIMTENHHEFLSEGVSCPDESVRSMDGIVLDHREVAEEFLLYLQTNPAVPGRAGEWNSVRRMVETITQGNYRLDG
jgi:hypothetical protein